MVWSPTVPPYEELRPKDHDEGGARHAPAIVVKATTRALLLAARRRPAPPARMVWFGATIPAEPLSLASTY